MKYTIKLVIETKENVFNGLDRSALVVADPQGKVESCYLLHKPENTPQIGQELVGTIAKDKGGHMKFTKDKAQFEAPHKEPAPRTFKADPEKLEQDKTLTVATNRSIQRQVAMKGTVDLIVAGKISYSDLHLGYTSLMELLSEPDWTKFQGEPAITDIPEDEDLQRQLDEAFDRDYDDGE